MSGGNHIGDGDADCSFSKPDIAKVKPGSLASMTGSYDVFRAHEEQSVAVLALRERVGWQTFAAKLLSRGALGLPYQGSHKLQMVEVIGQSSGCKGSWRMEEHLALFEPTLEDQGRHFWEIATEWALEEGSSFVNPFRMAHLGSDDAWRSGAKLCRISGDVSVLRFSTSHDYFIFRRRSTKQWRKCLSISIPFGLCALGIWITCSAPGGAISGTFNITIGVIALLRPYLTCLCGWRFFSPTLWCPNALRGRAGTLYANAGVLLVVSAVKLQFSGFSSEAFTALLGSCAFLVMGIISSRGIKLVPSLWLSNVEGAHAFAMIMVLYLVSLVTIAFLFVLGLTSRDVVLVSTVTNFLLWHANSFLQYEIEAAAWDILHPQQTLAHPFVTIQTTDYGEQARTRDASAYPLLQGLRASSQ